MTAPSETGEIPIFPRSQEPVTETVPTDSEVTTDVAYLPGALPPAMEDPSLSDNPDLVQAKNGYELARFRTHRAKVLGGYAGNLVASFRSDFEQFRQTFLDSGGQLDINGNVI